ncbi:MAG: InlB B-repeat-containing protein [Nanoarchaeota archaeon]
MKKLISLLIIGLFVFGISGCSQMPGSSNGGTEKYNLTLEKVGIGNVNIDPNQNNYEKGEEINLKATPNEDFLGWKGDLESEKNEEKIVMDSDYNITAEFKHKYLAVDQNLESNKGFIFNEDGTNIQELDLSSFEDFVNPVYIPKTKQIVFKGNYDNDKLYELDIYNGEINTLFQSNNDIVQFADAYYPFAWKDNNEKVLLTVGNENDSNDPIYSSIEIIEVDTTTGKNNQLTDNNLPDIAPSWSPDGEKVVFASLEKGETYNSDPTEGGDLDIYIMNSDGSNRQKLIEEEDEHLGEYGLFWLPEQDKLLIGSATSSGSDKIYVSDPNGDNVIELRDHLDADNEFSFEEASKEFEKIFYQDSSGYYISDFDGSNKVELDWKDEYDTYSFSFSPENQRFLFEDESFEEKNSSIYAGNTDTGSIEKIAEGNSPAWGKDGNMIIYENNGALYKISIEEGSERQLIDEDIDWEFNELILLDEFKKR